MIFPQNMTLKLMAQAAAVGASVSASMRLRQLKDRRFLQSSIRSVHSAYFEFQFNFEKIKWGL